MTFSWVMMMALDCHVTILFPSFCETWWQNPPSTLQVLEILLFVCMRLTAHPWDSFAALQPLLLCSWIMTVKFIGFSLNANYQCLKSDILSTLKTEHHPLISAEKPEDWTLDFAVWQLRWVSSPPWLESTIVLPGYVRKSVKSSQTCSLER